MQGYYPCHLRSGVDKRCQYATLTGSTPVTTIGTYSTEETILMPKTKGEKTMARKPMVTRTIITTKAIVLCLDIQNSEPFNKVVTLPRTYKDEKALMKQVSSVIDNDKVKAVHVVSKEEVETLYGMSEQDFIANAKPLDKETRKVLEQEDENDVDTEEEAE